MKPAIVLLYEPGKQRQLIQVYLVLDHHTLSLENIADSREMFGNGSKNQPKVVSKW